jgi:hypothetical protein
MHSLCIRAHGKPWRTICSDCSEATILRGPTTYFSIAVPLRDMSAVAPPPRKCSGVDVWTHTVGIELHRCAIPNASGSFCRARMGRLANCRISQFLLDGHSPVRYGLQILNEIHPPPEIITQLSPPCTVRFPVQQTRFFRQLARSYY